MLTPEQFYQSFDKAGLTRPTLWTPSVGLPGAGVQQSTAVRFHAPAGDVFSGEVISTNYRIEYPNTRLVGLKRLEVLTIGGVQYTVREGPKSKHDGNYFEAELRKGV